MCAFPTDLLDGCARSLTSSSLWSWSRASLKMLSKTLLPMFWNANMPMPKAHSRGFENHRKPGLDVSKMCHRESRNQKMLSNEVY